MTPARGAESQALESPGASESPGAGGSGLAATVDLAGVDAGYDSTAVLRSVDLAVADGEIVSLLGPSGCGKTTLLRTIAGLTPVTAGTITVAGRPVSGPGVHVPPERRQVGMVFQDGALFPHLSVGDNITFGLRRHDSPQARLAEVVELTGLADLVDRLPGTLSGGQQQRVALARALAPQPRVLLLDEPFSALDAALRVQLRREVRTILHDIGITTLIVTHDQDEAFSIGDRVAVMNQGRIAQVGTPACLYEHPSDPWVASFVGEANDLTGPYHQGRVHTPIGDIPVQVNAADGSTIRLVVRPEQIALEPGDGALVEAVEYFGHDARFDVAVGDATIGVRMTSAGFAPGDRVAVRYVGGPVPAWAV